jgi:Domain of unknown function (DUF4124)
MRTIGPWTLALLAFAAPGWSGDIYRWTDTTGTVHYSNMDIDGADATAVAPSTRPTSGDTARINSSSPRGADEAKGDDAYSAGASLRRNAMERDLRATEQRLREVDERLGTLARARGERSRGSDATGGVGAPASAPGGLDLRSDEERTLGTEREQLAQHATQVRKDAAELREEVTGRLGGTPSWWVEIR